jgi:L-alanine-DL-glutamate epimerase-like enolase superfamily enzyme
VSVADVLAALSAVAAEGGSATLPQAAAALDLARWDLRGRRAGRPVWELLGATAAPAVPVNLAVGLDERPPRGATALKLKVGDGDDLARVRAVRAAAGSAVALRLDANGAFAVPEAITFLRAVAEVGIECCEEPVHGAAALAEVARAVPEVPVAADESARELLARDGPPVCAAVCLKVSACGGITGLLRDAARARALGYGVYLASTLDGPLGIAAALHAAAVVGPDRFCGLATLDRFTARDPIGRDGPVMTAPSGPGLGDGLLGFYDEFGGDEIRALEVDGGAGALGDNDTRLTE